MTFSRSDALPIPPSPTELSARLSGIGMNLAVEPDVEAHIEETLLHASEVGMDAGDLRVLALLTTWLGVHHAHVNADVLIRLVAAHPSTRVKAYWAAVAQWLGKDRRLARFIASFDGPAVDLLPVGTEFQLARRGEDERFRETRLRVPAGTLRDRPEDVLSPVALVWQHRGYRNRVMMGPTPRADVWSELERDPTLKVAEAARRARCAFSTAWEASQGYRLLQAADASTPKGRGSSRTHRRTAETAT
ncbi:MAG: hypothetical protein RL685_5260 [Pseudomonadota bacterium]